MCSIDDLERPLTWFSSSRHSLTLNICEMVKDTARVIRYVYTWEHDREMASHVHVQRTQLMQQEVGLNCQLKSQSSRWPLTRVESREGSEVESIDWVDRQLSWIDCVARFDRFWGLLWKSLKTNKVLESGWIRREERDELPSNSVQMFPSIPLC